MSTGLHASAQLLWLVVLLRLCQSGPLLLPPQRPHAASAPATSSNGSTTSLSSEDVFIAVKTSGQFHQSRLLPVLATWYRRAGPHTWIFTDAEDAALDRLTGGRVINTGCAADHSRTALSCKMEAELAAFLRPPTQNAASTSPPPAWFCHVDDDNYVNMEQLVVTLAGYPATGEWYLGKVSTAQQLEVSDRRSSASPPPTHRFWFATGGAGFCLSRPLVERMGPWISGGRFQELADDIRLPDDVAVGYLVEVVLGVPLRPLADLHSHLEPLRLVEDLSKAITLSYSRYEDTGEDNVVEEEDGEDARRAIKEDRTRFLYIHCRLYPEDCSISRAQLLKGTARREHGTARTEQL